MEQVHPVCECLIVRDIPVLLATVRRPTRSARFVFFETAVSVLDEVANPSST